LTLDILIKEIVMLFAHLGLMAGFMLVFVTVGIAKQPLDMRSE